MLFYVEETCQVGNGASYRGTLAVTETGRTCQRLDRQTPHGHDRTARNYPAGGLVENYCRNPDDWSAIWCYTTDPAKRWELCDLPVCDYCKEESVETEAGQVTFPRTDGGSFNYSAERCNSSAENEKPLATRFCRVTQNTTVTAVWDQPVVLRCDTDLHNLSQIVVNNETALSVATELQVITTQAETLSSGDVSTITDILHKIVNASGTEQIGESILTIADNFIKVNETVLLDSHQTDRAPTR
ncbi:PREDICTED: apolipoprotein(a)-like [Branchiostoma belcheri]|uniref:Apolipoprotein(A)-like n=1 Tax=Branchiostoma belcheri TaxID=7741 RepID=A0A6P4XAX5_BRABE|nr:PREDICTED: apolipoprotein(a)-like [Branchiostoma belcheri]